MQNAPQKGEVMKGKVILAIFVASAAFALPFFLLPGAKNVPPTQETAAQTEPSESAETPQVSFDDGLLLRVETADGVEEMTLHDYLTGVVLAEMPTDFAPEALKAQAVASRTYALRKIQARKHGSVDVCGSFACCQAWTPVQEFAGTEALTRAEEAVSQTDGLVVTYSGELIDATFFSCAAGMTEAAAAVWGSDVPYLQAVESPEHEEQYEESVTFSAAEFAEKLAHPEADLSGSPTEWFGEETRTAGGGLDSIQIGGVEIRGTELRSRFSLRSTVMSFSAAEDGVTITTSGYGHRVGLSQYGADALAREGERFEEILLHYYQGTEIQRLYMA